MKQNKPAVLALHERQRTWAYQLILDLTFELKQLIVLEPFSWLVTAQEMLQCGPLPARIVMTKTKNFHKRQSVLFVATIINSLLRVIFFAVEFVCF